MRTPDDNPRAVFDVFWRTCAENDPLFAPKGIDWNAVRDRYRPTSPPGPPTINCSRSCGT
ncbi:hypothetical protein [Streptomyces sp. NPDC047108]|uniref:hypothetical protein n=1 Tax=Streptomyces sp. NPDC047108 TaxID=3155025 RepID=UPI0033CC79E9